MSLHVQDELGSWQQVGTAAIGGYDGGAALAGLRARAAELDPSGSPVTIWLPAEEIFCRKVLFESSGKAAIRAEAARSIAETASRSADEFLIDIGPYLSGTPAPVCGALANSVHEAEARAREWGFEVGPVSARLPGAFTGAWQPVFRASRAAARWRGPSAGVGLGLSAAALLVAVLALGTYDSMGPVIAEPSDLQLDGMKIERSGAAAEYRSPTVAPLAGAPRSSAPEAAAGTAKVVDPLPVVDKAALYARTPAPLSHPDLKTPKEDIEIKAFLFSTLPERPSPSERPTAVAAHASPDLSPIRDALDRMQHDVPGPLGTTGPAPAKPIAGWTVLEDAGSDMVVAELRTWKRAPRRPVRDPDIRRSAPAQPGATDPLDGPQQTADPASGGEDAASELAPAAMDSTPPQRPGQSQPPKVVAPTAADPARTAARSNEPPGEPAVAGAAADAAPAGEPPRAEAPRAPDSSDPPEAADVPSAFAATSAPAPVTRPRGLALAKVRPDGRAGTTISVAVPRSVRSAATDQGLALDQTSLIGVIDGRAGREALVRLSDGGFRKVARGDTVDGWRVQSISRDAMRLSRSGKNRTLLLIAR